MKINEILIKRINVLVIKILLCEITIDLAHVEKIVELM